MDKVIKNIDNIIANISISQKASKHPSNVEVIAASKSRDGDELEQVFNDGRIRVFGENRVQELVSKYDNRYTWDFIGQLQTNKVKYIIDKVRLIHSVDRENLAKEIDRQAKRVGKIQPVLMQINAGAEDNKGGVLISDAMDFAKALCSYSNIILKGIMVVTPLETDDRESLFKKSRQLFDRLKADNSNIEFLSMGMTNDYQLAIECGANMIRLGRVVFD